ncbi:PIN-like domain-containing protein [Nakamurella sp. GG22]
MAGVDEPIRFFIDESLMGLAKALPILRPDTTGCGHPRGGHGIIPSTLDPEWIPVVAKYDWIAIGADKKLRTRPGESNLVRAHGLRVIRLAPKRSLSNWAYLKMLMNRWDDIEAFVADRTLGPWFLRVRLNDVTEMDIGD